MQGIKNIQKAAETRRFLYAVLLRTVTELLP